MRKIFSNIIVTLTIASALILFVSCNPTLDKYEETRDMWDTFITVTLYSDDDVLAQEAINAAFNRIEDIGDESSIFDESSQISRLNQEGYLDNVNADLMVLVKESIEYGILTNGSFDITVQPLLDLWAGGLWMEDLQTQQELINETLNLIGIYKIKVNVDSISFAVDGMKITLGGITKGYAADEALKVISQRGIDNAIVSVGGDVSSIGTKPTGELWRVALVNPDNTNESLAIFEFAGCSVSTSGNYERYFSPDKEVHHIIDPRTGYSANECISVTTIAGTGLQSDVLSTAVFVMGPTDGMEIVEALPGVEALIVDTNRIIHYSSGIDSYLIE
ncbi:FAD:protein FMN transferase [Chloroflexota bacterium]